MIRQASRAPAMRALAPKQERSTRTLERLADATDSILRREGLEAATVPRIAEKAGMSVGVIYRRFPEKNALLRLVCERYVEQSVEEMRVSLDPPHCASLPLEQLVREIIRSLIAKWKADRGILRALAQYMETQRDAAFEKRVAEMNAESQRVIAELLLPHAHRIGHPSPEEAIRNGLLFVSLALKALLVTEPPRRLRASSLTDSAHLEDELTRLYLGYLDVRPRSRRRK